MENYKSIDSCSYILGISLTIEALKKVPEYIEKVYICSKLIKNDQHAKLLALTSKYNIPVIEDDRVVEKLSIKENCYGVGVFKKFYHDLETAEHIVLYRFSDFGELGTIFRSAVSFDFKDIVLINSKIDYFDPKVVRASMGSIFHLNIKKYDDFDAYKKDYDYHLYPFISRKDKELKQLNLVTPYSLVIPQNYYDLDDIFSSGYYLKHVGKEELSLSSLSSIVFNYCYLSNLKR